MKKVLFVCLGNICRSPLAEAIFEYKVKKLGLENELKADSAGTSTYHIGENPDARTIEVCHNHGIYINHKGRQITLKDQKDFDFIMAMDSSNYKNIIHMLSNKPEGLYLMRDFDTESPGADVPDPYYGGKEGFENIYQILDRSIDELLSHIQKSG